MPTTVEEVTKNAPVHRTENPQPKRRSVAQAENGAGPRFFIAKEGAGGLAPQLGKEFPNENEVMIESLRTGLSYFALCEWKATPDLSGRNPQIIKQAVKTAHS
jgi:hypothetical protein